MENWRDELPESLQASTNLAKYDSLEDALVGFDQAAGRLGRSIIVPPDDADDSERGEFYTKLQHVAPNLTIHPDHADDDDQRKEFWKLAGVPEDSKGYEVGDDTGLPAEYVENMRSVAAEAGWTKKQFKDTLGALQKEYEGQQTEAQESLDADAAVVKAKWGLTEDSKKQTIKALIAKFQDPANPLGELNAAAYLFLDNIVKAFSGKGPQAFKQPSGDSGMTPDEIEEGIARVDKKLMSSVHGAERKSLLNKKVALLEMRGQTE